jgi:two-component system alkaline phosphatase synthesis response regulator PhoP
MALVLIADGDSVLSEVLQQRFQLQGHQALVAHTANEAVSMAERYCPDVLVLNASLPRFMATEVYRRLRATPGLSKTPILFYGIQLQLGEEPNGLAQSGNYHIRRPCPLSELPMRTNSLLRRGQQEPTSRLPDHLIAAGLTLHPISMAVEANGRVSDLTPTEFELLRYLMVHVDEACSARRLLQNVWGYPPGTGSTDLVRTHIRNLRNKIEKCPARPVRLRTIRHRGYMLCSSLPGEHGEEDRRMKRGGTEETPVTGAGPVQQDVPVTLP